jgi:hypothetical protein
MRGVGVMKVNHVMSLPGAFYQFRRPQPTHHVAHQTPHQRKPFGKSKFVSGFARIC